MIYEKISGIPKNTSICSWWCLDYLNEKQVELHYTGNWLDLGKFRDGWKAGWLMIKEGFGF